MEPPVSVSIDALAAEDGPSAWPGLPPQAIGVPGVLIAIWVGAWQDVNVQVVDVVGGILLDELSHDVGGHGGSNPFTSVNT